MLTGGARTAVRRQQTLRASVDWSFGLLTEPERMLFRQLGVFMGGFDLEAAQAVCGTGAVEQYQVLDQLGLLVDKSLVVADDFNGKGLGSRLMESIMDVAREKGLSEVEGLVLTQNAGMLKLMKSLGYSIKAYPDDPDFRLVTHPL